MSIYIGSWIWPLIVTLATIAFFCIPQPSPRGYGDIGGGIVLGFQIMLAVIVNLVVWLAWSIAS